MHTPSLAQGIYKRLFSLCTILELFGGESKVHVFQAIFIPGDPAHQSKGSFG
jgi:hypothetical protein